MAVIVLFVTMTGCAARGTSPTSRMCDFTVSNQTPYAMAVRMLVRGSTTEEIGALNPGELLNHKAPCAQGIVTIFAVAIPAQVGAPTPHGYIRRWADLLEGQRVTVALSWP